MIRKYEQHDLEQIMAIWLKTNKQAHTFIDENFFTNQLEMVKMMIPLSTVYVQDLNGIKGFIGLTDNYIAGLFVDPLFQRQSIGHALLNKAKQLHSELLVHVYKKNEYAVQFYLSQGFKINEEANNPETGEMELLMTCQVVNTVKIGKCAL